ncbi:MAG: hypothetical protein NTV68_15955, partial [Methanomicrobiales archaeon]|nr:hypothetical protein [Methanomicrobiales archaeon]
CTDPPALQGFKTDIHEKAFLYSERLALFQQASQRNGMFIDKEPGDSFSVNVERLGERVAGIVGIVKKASDVD